MSRVSQFNKLSLTSMNDLCSFTKALNPTASPQHITDLEIIICTHRFQKHFSLH